MVAQKEKPLVTGDRASSADTECSQCAEGIVVIVADVLRRQVAAEIDDERSDELGCERSFALRAAVGFEAAGEGPKTLPERDGTDCVWDGDRSLSNVGGDVGALLRGFGGVALFGGLKWTLQGSWTAEARTPGVFEEDDAHYGYLVDGGLILFVEWQCEGGWHERKNAALGWGWNALRVCGYAVAVPRCRASFLSCVITQSARDKVPRDEELCQQRPRGIPYSSLSS